MTRPPIQPELLEPRRLLSGIALHGHVLTLAGSHTAANTITFGLTADGKSVDASVSFATKTGEQTYSKTFPLTDHIRQINVIGGDGADLVMVDQSHGAFGIKTLMKVGAGNDTVHAGDEPDRIYGEAGDDLLDAGGGNNTVFGGTGNDTLSCGGGNDYLNGGVGHDVLNGGDGNDTLADAWGPNTLYGGAGHNTFAIVSLARNPVNDYTKKKDKLHYVNPTPAPASTSLLSSLFPITSLL